jgi:M6 family metalloprotease-like protein
MRKIRLIIFLLLISVNSSYSSDNKYYINIYKTNNFTNLKGNLEKEVSNFKNINIIVIRVEFQKDSISTAHGKGSFNLSTGSSAKIDPPPHNRTYFEDHLEALKRYYKRVSKGKVNISYTVFPNDLNASYKLPKEMKYYSPNTTKDEKNRRLCELLSDSFIEADKDPAVDFSQYNSFIVFHAGVGADFSINPYYNPFPNDVPSVFLTFYDLSLCLGNNDPAYKGINVNEGKFFIMDGIILPETESQEDIEIGLNGIIAHQFGHQLGLPSLFNTETGSAGIGQWGLMDMGFGNYSGLIPAEPCAWSKVFLGWETPIEVDNGENLEIHSSLSNDPKKIYKVSITSEEYFLLENRVRDFNKDGLNIIKSPRGVLLEADDYDTDIPGSGMLIWHIDERIIKKNIKENKINVDKNKKGVCLMEADGSQDIGEVFEWILPGFPTPANGTLYDAFFKGNNDAFTPNTNPSSKSNEGANSHISIYAISDTGNVMKFSLKKDFYYKGFPSFTGGKFEELSPYSSDIDGDGKMEIIAVTRDGIILGWNGENGTPVISNNDSTSYLDYRGEIIKKKIPLFAEIDESVSLSPLGVDFTGDGKMEIAVISNSGNLHVWKSTDYDQNGRADLLFNVNIGSKPTSEMISAQISQKENIIVVGDANGNIVFVNSSGQVSKKLLDASSSIKGLCLVKDNSGKENIIAVSKNGKIFNLSLNGDINWTKNELLTNPYSPASGDLNRDGRYEVIIADSSGNVFVCNADGSGEINFRIKEDYPFLSPPSLGDINGDGYGEIVIRSLKRLHTFNYNGTQLNNFPVVVEWENAQPERITQTIIGDINGDNATEIITGTQNGLITAFDTQGDIVDNFPLTIGENVKSTPFLSDLDGDGDIEIAAVSDDYYIYVWDFPSTYNKGNVYWGSYLGDITHSAQLKDIITQPPQPSEELLVKKSVYNYPNPTEGDYTTIHYIVQYPAEIVIKIYDLTGEVIDEIKTSGKPLVDNEVTWNLNGIESGVYNAKLEASGNGKREYTFFKIAVIK